MDEQSASHLTETTLRDYARIIFRHKLIVMASILAVTLTVAFGLQLKTPVYRASVKMLVSAEKQTQSPFARDLAGHGRTEANITQSEIVKSAPVIERAVRAVRLDQRPLDDEKAYAAPLRRKMIERETAPIAERLEVLPRDQREYILFRRAVDLLQRALTVEPIRGTNLLSISVQDYDPIVAATLANVVSRSYVIFDLEQQLAESATKYGDLHPTVAMLKGHIGEMKRNLNGEPLDNIEAIGPATVKIISQASMPVRPEGHPKALVLALAGFLSFVLGVALAFIFEYLDPTVRSPRDLTATVRAPLIATIPVEKRTKEVLLNASAGQSAGYMEAYHELAGRIRFAMTQKNMKVFLFTAPDVGEGTTTVVSNLGMCLANDFKKKTLIIDAHYHNGGLHKNFDNTPGPGLSDVLAGKAAFSQVCREITPNLSILSAGETGTDQKYFLDTKVVADVIHQARKDYDAVLIDTADLRSHRDAVAIGSLADGLILVVSEGKTRRPAIIAATNPLKDNGFNVIGAVLNRRTFSLPRFVYERV